MLKNKLVTIGICAYNAEKFIKEAIDSALCQTHENFELIILNDGSTDATKDIILEYDDSRIIFINIHKNQGVSYSRQLIKSIAKGDYLVFLDSDDIFYNDRIEYLLNQAILNKSDITSDAYECIDESNHFLYNITIPDYVTSDKYFTRLLERNRMLPHPLISRKCYSNIDYDLRLRRSEDFDFWIKATINGYTFSKTDTIKLKYRKVKNSLSSNVIQNLEATKMVLSKYNLTDLILLYKKRNFAEEIINYFGCIYSIFTNDYYKALQFAKKPWLYDSNIDQNFYIGTLSLATGDINVAKKYLRLHLKHFPNSPAGLNNYGVLMQEQKEKEKYFNLALKNFPEYSDAKENLNNSNNKITFTQINI